MLLKITEPMNLESNSRKLPFKLLVLASGVGTTTEPMLKAGLVSYIVSNNFEPGIKKLAHQYAVPFFSINRHQYLIKDRHDQTDLVRSAENYNLHLLDIILSLNPSHIAQQGWMVKTPKILIDQYEGRITNSHPGPTDPGYLDLGGSGMHGLAVHYAALEIFRRLGRQFITGPTIHLVTEEYDQGMILKHTPVLINVEDTVESLLARVKEVEALQSLNYWLKVKKTGQMETFSRTERLFQPGETELVSQIKLEAIDHYKH